MSLTVQNSLDSSNLRALVESATRTALNSTGSPVSSLTKNIFFVKTFPDLNNSTINAFIALLALHTPEIMFKITWGGGCYVYDWDAHPVWDFTNGNYPFNNVSINDVQWFPDASGYALTGKLDGTNPNPTYQVAVTVQWNLIPTTIPFKVKIQHLGHGVNSSSPNYSASLALARWPPPGIPYPSAIAWPGTIVETITSMNPIPDATGLPGYPAQMFEIPVPAALGIFNLGIQDGAGGPYINSRLFGEFYFYGFY